jgi:hypothetical protein
MCAFRFPKCELSEGYKKWRKMNAMLTENLGAVAGALTNMPKCGQPGAHKTFCINEPTGTGLYCKNSAYILYVWACMRSVMAIESPGGDDDRQWLSFWIITIMFNVFEAMTDVLLSWLPTYYEMKFVFLCWLIFFNGADIMYRKVHACFDLVHKLMVKLGLIVKEEMEEWDEEDYLNQLPHGLADDIRDGDGVEKFFSSFSSPAEFAKKYGIRRCEQLLRVFNRTQPRWVDVTLVEAENLPAMDPNGFSDPYCLISLIAPSLPSKGENTFSLKNNPWSWIKDVKSFFKDLITACPHKCSEDDESTTPGPGVGVRHGGDGSDGGDGEWHACGGGERASLAVRRGGFRKWNTLQNRIQKSKSCNDSIGGFMEGDVTSGAGAGIAGVFVKHMWEAAAVVRGGPVGPKNEYSKVKSKTVPRNLNPIFNQFFELHLEGGNIDNNGDYCNADAPFTKLRLTMWDHDVLSNDDYIGECTVPLGPLMSCRTLEGWFKLEDPENMCHSIDQPGVALSARVPPPRVHLRLKWNEEALLPGSLRPQKKEGAGGGGEVGGGLSVLGTPASPEYKLVPNAPDKLASRIFFWNRAEQLKTLSLRGGNGLFDSPRDEGVSHEDAGEGGLDLEDALEKKLGGKMPGVDGLCATGLCVCACACAFACACACACAYVCVCAYTHTHTHATQKVQGMASMQRPPPQHRGSMQPPPPQGGACSLLLLLLHRRSTCPL